MKELAAPLRIAAHRHLRRFHQQEAQQRVALLADVAQSSSVSAGLFRRYQPHVAGNLLRAGKTFRRSNHQLERQCGQRTHSGMRAQLPRHGPALHDLFQLSVQFMDLGREPIE